MTIMSDQNLANAIRFLSADAIQKANSGHPGMPMGMADVATVLFKNFLKFNPQEPKWADRDRFVLSAGHGSMLIYSLLYLTGYEQATIDEIKNFRQLGSCMAGHPEYGHLEGVETTTGPLGQGIATAVGMALAEKMLAEKYGKDIVDHYTYVIAGDGCLMEGISQEAISLSGHLGLDKMIVLWDNNNITIDGKVEVSSSENQFKRFEAAGWDTFDVDGHNSEEIKAAIANARRTSKPSLISCRTVIGKGAPTKQGTEHVHGAPLGEDELAAARKALGWTSGSFEVPEEIIAEWRSIGAKGQADCSEWQDRLNSIPADIKDEFERIMSGKLPASWKDKVAAYKQKLVAEKPKVATRKASQMALEELVPAIPEMLGGSADLTGSNLTKTSKMTSVTPSDFSGNYMHYGIREHGMAAAMNGIALHGGFLPYSGTFFAFVDYLRPSLRLGALMGVRAIHVMTHDSIGLGEDGPTHQPIEHLASVRAMPNVLTFRPCDVVETAECWELAVENEGGPSVIVLSRQGLPTLRDDVSKNPCANGGYVISEADGECKATIIATGSEVEIAMNAQAALKEKGVAAAVVSMPCTELFDKQDEAYKASVLGDCPRVVIEAASPYGWERYVGDNGKIIAIDSFGASAPAPELYKHFGITAEAVVNAVTSLV
ncbi:MAG: transketolase [Alphaproteobacteria bacterium]|nr:transketolase [Alphaproteobacteria bacterium]